MPRSAIKWGIAMLLLAIGDGLVAQPAGNRIIEDAVLDQAGTCGIVTIRFALPMQYLSHFPAETGKELRIQLRPLGIRPSDMPALGHNEPIRVNDLASLVPVQYFDYEGQYNPNAPSIYMTFERPVHFRVRPGDDFRSLHILLSARPFADCKLKL